MDCHNATTTISNAHKEELEVLRAENRQMTVFKQLSVLDVVDDPVHPVFPLCGLWRPCLVWARECLRQQGSRTRLFVEAHNRWWMQCLLVR